MIPNRPDTATYRSFEGTEFTLTPLDPTLGGSSTTLRLDAVRDLGSRALPGGTLPCYTLSFSQSESTSGGHARQGTYRLSHAVLGDQELFVVPVGPNGSTCMCYEIVFN